MKLALFSLFVGSAAAFSAVSSSSVLCKTFRLLSELAQRERRDEELPTERATAVEEVPVPRQTWGKSLLCRDFWRDRHYRGIGLHIGLGGMRHRGNTAGWWKFPTCSAWRSVEKTGITLSGFPSAFGMGASMHTYEVLVLTLPYF